MSRLQMASDLALPDETVTQTIAVLAKRRAGKSYLARRLAEQLHHARQQIVIVDPKGDWWGIRSSADGKRPGLPIVIIGGERGDVPLEVHAGEVVAKLIVVERVSALLDLSLLRKKEVAVFMADFLEHLYRLKARERYRTPMMLLVDEADAIAPQKPMPGEERMLGAAEDIVRRGGQRGIGCTTITQRSAVLNKNVLTQAQVLIALRTIAPQDLVALKAWVDVHGTAEELRTLMASVPSLPVGDAWVWSPGWPTLDGIFSRHHVLQIETFDSGATPKPGETRREPKQLADVDLETLRRQMSETIERAKADDPKELRKRIAALERELAARRATPPATEVHRVEVPIVTDEQMKALEDVAARVLGATDRLQAMTVAELRQQVDRIVAVGGELRDAAGTIERAAAPTKVAPSPAQSARHCAPAAAGPPGAAHTRNGAAPDAAVGTGGLRRILVALAQRPHGLSARQIGVRAQLSSRSGTFDTYLSRARSNRWVDGERSLLRITDDGLRALGDYEPLPTGAELLNHWLRELGQGGAARMLRTLADAYPTGLSRTDLAAQAGMATSGTFDTYLSRLRGLELIEGRGELRASAELFDSHDGAQSRGHSRSTIVSPQRERTHTSRNSGGFGWEAMAARTSGRSSVK